MKAFSTARRQLIALGGAIPLNAVPGYAIAQGSPRTIRLLVGYSAGGGVDAVARLIAPRLAELLGQSVVVENRAGATGLIAAEAVSKAAPDGLTLMLADSALLVAKLLNPKQSFDPLSALLPLAGTFSLPLMIVANTSFEANDPVQLVKRLQSSPGRYSYATSGVGTVHHLGFEMFKRATRSFVVHVPYRGASQIIPDVIGGQIPLGVVSAAAGFAQARAGKLKALALMSQARLPGMEAVAPLAQAVPGFDIAPQLFVVGPPGLAPDLAARLGQAIKEVCDSPTLATGAAGIGAVRGYLQTTELRQQLTRESAALAKVIQEQNIQAES